MLKKVLLLGSGGLRIGQAGEFDYSGSQAIKALKEEGVKVMLVNPNIATIQTDPGMADKLYLEPLIPEMVAKIIKKERPDGILLGFGGQTALNLGLELEANGVLKKYGVRVLGTPVQTIRITEDRDLFKQALGRIGVITPKSFAATTVKEALIAGKKIGYPVMLRAGFSLGGLGSGKIENEAELEEHASEALHGAPQILIEEYLGGWKEVEYEVVRDRADNAITVCNMENFDPMGIHTGESIVVAPSQTLTNSEYHRLREISIRVAREAGIIGECNIQFALNPKTSDYRVIEMNARLSRSSALASKATGYPLAFVAAKLALGKLLPDLKNSVTKQTSAFFEPALDYLVVKIPRWDLTKFKTANRHIGSEMKSVGEVMAIGRSFPETLQKAVRMLNLGASGLSDYPGKIKNALDEIERPTDRRLFAIYQALRAGASVATIHNLSKIDPWFLHHLKAIAAVEKKIKSSLVIPTDPERRRGGVEESRQSKRRDSSTSSRLGRDFARNDIISILRTAKQFGFADKTIARLTNTTEDKIRALRLKAGITPVIKQIDTLAGEFKAETNYLYTTYHGAAHDLHPSKKRPVVVLGSGPYCIGSSVEFDWGAVNTARALRRLGKSVVIINSNPETVSTDYDESDRLYFEELTLERVQDIADWERPLGTIVSVGGQIPNTLARALAARGAKLLGTSANSIDKAENRERFGKLLERLRIDQPPWIEAKTLQDAAAFADSVGYPVIVRPSYVLSGTAMNVIRSENELERYLKEAAQVWSSMGDTPSDPDLSAMSSRPNGRRGGVEGSREHPVVISQFIEGAKELEIDGVAERGQIVIEAVTEHVENAGIHSGDATVVLPPQKLYLETVRRAKAIARRLARDLNITGPFNIQFLAKNNDLKVIECNLRASRSFPFVSKVTGHNFIEIATQAMLGRLKNKTPYNTADLPYVGVKTPQFSYARLKGADPVAGVEMASTGEVAALGENFLDAFYRSWLSADNKIRGWRILLSIGGAHKQKFLEVARELDAKGFALYATEGTHDWLASHGVATVFTPHHESYGLLKPETKVRNELLRRKPNHLGHGAGFTYKASEAAPPNILELIANQKVDLIVNIPTGAGQNSATDGFRIRRLAIAHHLPVVTNPETALFLLQALAQLKLSRLMPRSAQEFLNPKN